MQAASDSSAKVTPLSVISNHDSPVQAERFSANIQITAFSSKLDQATQSPHFCLPHENSRKVRSSKAWKPVGASVQDPLITCVGPMGGWGGCPLCRPHI